MDTLCPNTANYDYTINIHPAAYSEIHSIPSNIQVDTDSMLPAWNSTTSPDKKDNGDCDVDMTLHVSDVNKTSKLNNNLTCQIDTNIFLKKNCIPWVKIYSPGLLDSSANLPTTPAAYSEIHSIPSNIQVDTDSMLPAWNSTTSPDKKDNGDSDVDMTLPVNDVNKTSKLNNNLTCQIDPDIFLSKSSIPWAEMNSPLLSNSSANLLTTAAAYSEIHSIPPNIQMDTDSMLPAWNSTTSPDKKDNGDSDVDMTLPVSDVNKTSKLNNNLTCQIDPGIFLNKSSIPWAEINSPVLSNSSANLPTTAAAYSEIHSIPSNIQMDTDRMLSPWKSTTSPGKKDNGDFDVDMTLAEINSPVLSNSSANLPTTPALSSSANLPPTPAASYKYDSYLRHEYDDFSIPDSPCDANEMDKSITFFDRDDVDLHPSAPKAEVKNDVFFGVGIDDEYFENLLNVNSEKSYEYSFDILDSTDGLVNSNFYPMDMDDLYPSQNLDASQDSLAEDGSKTYRFCGRLRKIRNSTSEKDINKENLKNVKSDHSYGRPDSPCEEADSEVDVETVQVVKYPNRRPPNEGVNSKINKNTSRGRKRNRNVTDEEFCEPSNPPLKTKRTTTCTNSPRTNRRQGPSTCQVVPSTFETVQLQQHQVPSTFHQVPSTSHQVPSSPRPVPSSPRPVRSSARPLRSTTRPVPSTSRPVRSSSFNYSPSSFNISPSSFNYSPSSSISPSSLNFSPSSLNFSPSSLNFSPSSLNFSPSSLNFSSSSLILIAKGSFNAEEKAN
ncbi:hypothetical protein CDAR_292761 [Caerostris darwini]|uniref:Uncharacterized protein n=1 Tax=Caerostris darwini TaxID=1538125 RepID=A0AAV4SBR0_9ARAC|nr:hypothetical protein CDAR_292761 [Caerostris darwini]